jgi:hypothetical protein
MEVLEATNSKHVDIKKLFFRPGKFMGFILIIMFPHGTFAQLELYGKFNFDGSVEPVINYAGSKKVSPKLAVTFFGLVRQKWSQALIGLSFTPSRHFSVSASAGLEHGHRLPRYSASVSARKGQNTFLLLGELGEGNRNYLYKVNVFHQLSKKISLGFMDWRYHGLGPNFRYNVTKIESTLWIMPAYDHEARVARCMVGYSLHM